jgi:hypothetical protein
MKLILKTHKPRNPFATAGRLRLAGAHRRSASAQRQRAQRELRAELARPSP